MQVAEKKNKNKQYKPILDGIPDWPVYRLSKNRKEFVEEVSRHSFNQIKQLRPTTKQLLDELEATVYREQQRMKRNRWRVDPADEPGFWAKIKEELAPLNGDISAEAEAKGDELLYRIVFRYADEIAGNFKPSSYRVARELLRFWFARLLNG
ncbi:MAG TPA: glycerol-3-phosphate acyltransferase, partial [Chryseosolibacter sp.]